MVYNLYWHFMNFIGYRKVLYLPSEKGFLYMADFYAWEFCPWIEKRNYTEKDFPFYMLR